MPTRRVPGQQQANGRMIRLFNEAGFRQWGTVCHLCGEPGADTMDHLKPVSRHPELLWDIDNVRPAHRICNSRRGDAELSGFWSASQW